LRDLAFKTFGRRFAIEVLLAVLIGALMGLLGPFDTYSMPAGPRIAYWIFMIVAGLMIFRPTIIVSDWFAAETGLPHWVARGLAVALGSLPMTLLVAWLLSGFDLSRAMRFNGMSLLYGNVFLISLLTNGIFQAVFRRGVTGQLPAEPQIVPDEPVQTQSQPLFAARLPIGFGPLIALSSEDHYVRVHSAAVTALILIRLRDAIAELDPAIEGMQVHRSWWVARAAVTGHKSDGRAIRLVLSNGLEVPVSRERIQSLRQRNLI
jgi:LytTr DNA-binding domain